MNIIWLTLESIFPTNTGGRIGIFKRIEQLSKKNNIYLFYLYDDLNELKYIDDLKRYCKEVHPYSRNDNIKKHFYNILKYPYTVSSRFSKILQNDLINCINKNNIDLINVDFPHMYSNVVGLNLKNIPIVLNEHNIEWKVYKLISKSQKSIIKKIIYYIDSFRLRKYENKILNKREPDLITFVSNKDLEEFGHDHYNINKNKLILVPVGADIVVNSRKTINNRVLSFIGKMSYGPNIEAVLWFVKDIFPIIKEKCNNLKFYIVGKNPTKEVLKLANEDIIVTGTVDSVDYYYDISDIIVLPLKNGGGVKVKLLEALGHKKQIVSSTIGVEGTCFADNKTILVSDNPKKFAEYCIKFFNNDKDVVARNNAALKIFEEKYTWKMICDNYEKELRGVIKK